MGVFEGQLSCEDLEMKRGRRPSHGGNSTSKGTEAERHGPQRLRQGEETKEVVLGRELGRQQRL